MWDFWGESVCFFAFVSIFCQNKPQSTSMLNFLGFSGQARLRWKRGGIRSFHIQSSFL